MTTSTYCPHWLPESVWKAYATWKAAHLPLLERMVAWAETPPEQREVWRP